jgi:hypothetical protein
MFHVQLVVRAVEAYQAPYCTPDDLNMIPSKKNTAEHDEREKKGSDSVVNL